MHLKFYIQQMDLVWMFFCYKAVDVLSYSRDDKSYCPTLFVSCDMKTAQWLFKTKM